MGVRAGIGPMNTSKTARQTGRIGKSALDPGRTGDCPEVDVLDTDGSRNLGTSWRGTNGQPPRPSPGASGSPSAQASGNDVRGAKQEQILNTVRPKKSGGTWTGR